MELIRKIKNKFFSLFNIGLKPYKHEWIEPESIKESIPEKEEAHLAPRNIKSLLDSLDDVYTHIKRAEMTANFYKSTIKTIKKMGATVLPDDFNFALHGDRVQIETKNRPALIYLYGISKKKHNPDKIYPSTFFAVKNKNLPSQLARVSGDVYQVGFGYYDSNMSNKTKWISTWIVIDQNGKLNIPKVNETTKSNIKTKNQGYISVSNKSWTEQFSLQNAEITKKKMIIAFVVFFNLWNRRFDYWKVITNKRGMKASFLIDKLDTKYFFKDRNIEARTLTGQKKKIFHYVSMHNRKTKRGLTKVKEHTRGIRKFNWDKYECSIVAPEFNKADIDRFTIPSEGTREKGTKYLKGTDAIGMISESTFKA